MRATRPDSVRRARGLLAASAWLLWPAAAWALITGGGSEPMADRGWPQGTLALANLPSRLGWWEGPPFGGGEYHFQYRCGGTAEFNEALKLFARIEVPKLVRRSMSSDAGRVVSRLETQPLEVIVHDGAGPSVMFAADGKKEPADWTLTVWVPRNWHGLFNSPRSLWSADQANFRQPVPPPVIDVYVGGESPIEWDQASVPEGIRVIDRRASSKLTSAFGRVFDMATHRPIPDAKVFLADRANRNPDWAKVPQIGTDEEGCFTFERIPRADYDVHVHVEGYAPRREGGAWTPEGTCEFVVLLSKKAAVTGTVTDPDGKPIPGVKVTAQNTLGIDGQGYPCGGEDTTNEDGRFEIVDLPEGFANLRCRAPSMHQKTSIFQVYEVPSDGNVLVLTGTGTVRGKVVFKGGPPRGEVHVSICPPGGARAGTWGGSARCGEGGRFEFTGVPPGEYLVSTNIELEIHGDETGAERVKVEAGKTIEVDVDYSGPVVRTPRRR